MRLIHDVKGVSKLIFILLLLVSFIVGALLSYIWTMGYYAPLEFHLPSQGSVTIDKVEFFAENATFFNVTVLNPSYSPSKVTIKQIMVSTNDGLLYKADNPSLPLTLAPSYSHNFRAYWNWGNYTGQTVNVIAVVTDGSGATFQARTPSMNLAITSVNFYPEVSVTYFNITVESIQSTTFVNIKTISVNGVEVTTVAPTLPYRFEPNASATFKVERNWTDLQGKTVTVALNTLQGYEAYRTETAPPPVVLTVTSLVFNTTDTLHFNITIHNNATSPAKVDITKVTVYLLGQIINTTEISPQQLLQPNSEITLTCSWDWSSYQGKNTSVTVTVQTLQGFEVSAEASIP